MAVPGNFAIRSVLQHRFIRLPLKLALGLAVAGVAGFVAVAIYNAFDEDLSAQAQALLAPPAMGKIEDKNGYIAFLGLVAPKGYDQMEWGRKAAVAFTAQAQPGFTRTPEWKEATRSHIQVPKAQKQWCTPEARDCLAEAKTGGEALAKRLAEGDNAELLARYRKVRAALEFSELYMGALMLDIPSSYFALRAGASLVLADIALKAGAGDFEAAVAELEREVAFHRRIIGGGRILVTVLSGEAMLARDLLTISELLRTSGGRIAPYHARLRELTRPQASTATLQPAFRAIAHEKVNWAQHWRTFLRDNADIVRFGHEGQAWENLVLSFFIRPNETANVVASFMTAEASIAGVPAAQFDQEAARIRNANDALLERPWYAEGSNPVGKGMVELATVRLADYASRMNDLQALERMVDLQATLAARSITDTAAIAAFVAGEGVQSRADPYTGKAFAFDPDKRLLSFEPRVKGRWSGDLMKRYGKAGIVL